ncbi:MAG: menaquinone biosynthesis protein [Bacteroidota bacterium]
MIKVTAVSYLNTKPLLYGLIKSGLQDEIDLQLNIPSECANKLVTGEVDLGLVPVAIIPKIEGAKIISDYCIGTVGAVKTVCIFSQCPIEKITDLYLDYHSRTSVELVKVLMREHWRLAPNFLEATPGFEEKIAGTTGAVVIGDRAIGMEQKCRYVYDLGEAWMAYSGLPFVFAAWVSNRPIESDFVERFNAALKLGVEDIPNLMYILPSPVKDFDLEKYFTENISYKLDGSKRKGLDLFLRLMNENAGSTVASSSPVRQF